MKSLKNSNKKMEELLKAKLAKIGVMVNDNALAKKLVVKRAQKILAGVATLDSHSTASSCGRFTFNGCCNISPKPRIRKIRVVEVEVE